ncbi:MAG TPA: AsmA-like C-terminal region-containing protein, partial [Longimicrobiales bacterium]
VSLRFGGIPYLNRVRLALDATLGVDNAARKITVKDNRIRVNELELAVNGSVATRPDSSYDLDLSLRAPKTDFKEILSLVPAVYARDFSKLQATGSMALAGWVRGHYAGNAFPALALEARVDNGTFRYPDLPLPARDIALQLAVGNPGGTVDGTVVNLQRFHVVIGSNPVDGSLLVRTPVSDPDVDARIVGRVDLADVARTVKLASVQQLTGVVAANAAMRARVSDVNARRYERVAASGSASIDGLVVRAKDIAHPVEITHARLSIAPPHVEVSSFRGKLGRSDIALTGYLDNVLGYLLHDEALRGQAKVSSSFLDLNEWRSGGKLQVIPVPANVDFVLDAGADRVAYGPLTLQHASGTLQVKNRRVDLKDFRFDMMGGAVTMAGSYETTNLARPTFDFDMKAANLEVPAAFAGLKTVQAFVPVAQYTQGKASVEMKLAGPLGQDMIPDLTALSAAGLFQTAGVVLKEFPAMIGLADLLKVQELRDPGFKDLKSSFEIKNGRLVVKPFDAHVGQLTMNVAGSNGIDRSLDYLLALKLPRAALGAEANQVVTRLVAQTGQLGLKLQPSDVVTLGVKLGGTVTKPTLATNVRDVAGSAAAAVGQSLQQAATARVDSARQRLDAAAQAAQQRASAQAAQLIADAEQKAGAMRAQARSLADAGRQQAYAQADSLAAKPQGALAKMAARTAADRLKKEADARAQQIVTAANARADSLVAQAKAQAAALQAH